MNRLYTTIGFILILLFSVTGNAAEQLYKDQPTVTPDLAVPGEFKVGVTTLEVSNPKQLNVADFNSQYDRPLTLEIWYPATINDEQLTTYKNVTRSHNAFELQANAYRDAQALKNDKTFPLIVLSHGYTGYRTIMFYLGEHLASHGYVVAAIDHTESTNSDVNFEKSPGAGFPSTLINRARDQQFVLDYFLNKIPL